MKVKILFVLIMSSILLDLKSQEEIKQNKLDPFIVNTLTKNLKSSASYIGGFSKMFEQLYDGLLYSSFDEKGLVKVKVDINNIGQVESVIILTGLSVNQNSHIGNAIKSLPNFIPAQNLKGENVYSEIEFSFPYHQELAKDTNYKPLKNFDQSLKGNWEYNYTFDKSTNAKTCSKEKLTDYFIFNIDSTTFLANIECDVITGSYKVESKTIRFNWDKYDDLIITCEQKSCFDPTALRPYLKTKLKYELLNDSTLNIYIGEKKYINFSKY